MSASRTVVFVLLLGLVAALFAVTFHALQLDTTAQAGHPSSEVPSQVGPLVFVKYELDEDDNNNGQVDCGEQEIELTIFLRNDGSQLSATPQATISTGDPFVTSLRSTSFSYSDIPPGETRDNGSEPEFSVAANTPNGHLIKFDLDIRDSRPGAGQWTASFEVPVVCGAGATQYLYLPLVQLND